MKWGFIPQGDGKPHYLVVNADESEPGTCKDIPLMMAKPAHAGRGRDHRLLRDPRQPRVHLRPRRGRSTSYAGCSAPSPEAYAAGHLGKDILGSGYDLEVTVHAGAGAYICGEETALLDSLEGRRGQPRLRPPFPAIAGLYACPTVINNVESIASVPGIVANGAEWFGVDGHREEQGLRRSTRCPATSRGPASTRRRWASRCASCSTSPAASARATS